MRNTTLRSLKVVLPVSVLHFLCMLLFSVQEGGELVLLCSHKVTSCDDQLTAESFRAQTLQVQTLCSV